jgi:hypothetical protein
MLKNRKKLLMGNISKFITFIAMLSLMFGCGADPVPPTINPENGGTPFAAVGFGANNLAVVVNSYVETGYSTYLLLEPLSGSNTVDITNAYTYSYVTDDIHAQLPSQSDEYKGITYFGKPNSRFPSSYCGNVFTCGSPITFNSIVGHSPYVHLTVTAHMVGSTTTLGPVPTSAYDWFWGPEHGGAQVVELDAYYYDSGVADYVCHVNSPWKYCVLPNPITDTNPASPTFNQQICGLQLKVFSGRNGGILNSGILGSPYNVTVDLVGVGPWVGGTDSSLLCFSAYGSTCNNYWNKNNEAGLFVSSPNRCHSYTYSLSGSNAGNIGLSQTAMGELNLPQISLPEHDKYYANAGWVVWRFRE